MEIGLRSGSRKFRNSTDLKIAIDIAIVNFVSNTKVVLFNYLMAEPRIPVDTGLMRDTAILHVWQSPLTVNFDIDVWFDTFYAHWVEENTGFLESIETRITLHIIEQLENAFNTEGFDVEVTF